MGYDVAYSTDIDTHWSGAKLLDYKTFLSPAHDEYWTSEMFTAVESARDATLSPWPRATRSSSCGRTER